MNVWLTLAYSAIMIFISVFAATAPPPFDNIEAHKPFWGQKVQVSSR